ncbi:MAG: Sec-independent protein translocase subunit TatA/TatB [Chloroflexota bacterium]|nr:MAG: hypothetical protein DLM70_18130 [Chloroflexota bacterium]
MFGHFPELVIILVLALIVFGPEKLPEAAASAGKMVRELREVMDSAMHPQDEEVPEEFSTYYYESLQRSGEDAPEAETGFDRIYADSDEAHNGSDPSESSGSHPVSDKEL